MKGAMFARWKAKAARNTAGALRTVSGQLRPVTGEVSRRLAVIRSLR